jgi:hypothetical protein
MLIEKTTNKKWKERIDINEVISILTNADFSA